MLRFIGWKYLIVILLVFIQETVIVTSKAYILGLIIYYFDNKSEGNEPKVYLLAAGFCGLTAIYLLTFNTNYFISEVLGMKLKVALCTVIYNKAINLSSSSLGKSNIGQIVNLLANDVNKFYSNIFTIPYLITNPFLLIIAVLMLWQYCRWAPVVGLSVIYLYVPLQIVLGKLYSKLRLQAAVLGDERLNLLNEVIAGMRLVKMYTWELPFASLIEKIRNYTNTDDYFVISWDFLLLQEKENNSGEIANEKTKQNECGIWMKNVTATWNNKIGLTLNGIKLCVQPGELLAVIGSVGSGKTSLLMSILGEIPIISGTVSVKGKISYSSQEAWIFNGTIRENIIFGEEYQDEKYRKVLHITSLEKDIRLFPNGDLTLVGERGVIMSGGQKARINLARALYLDADIFLLDDPLSAVDGPVARHLFQKCIMEYLNDKICILVTHQTQFLNSTTKVLMLNGGKCEFIGSCYEVGNIEKYTATLPEEYMKFGDFYYTQQEIENNNHDDISHEIQQTTDGNLITKYNKAQEDKRVGVVGLSTYEAYFNAGAGFFFKMLIVFMLFISQIVFSASDYWLIIWLQEERSYTQIAGQTTNFTSKILTINNTRNEKLQEERSYTQIAGQTTNFTSKILTINNTRNEKFYKARELNIYIYFGFISAIILTAISSISLLYKLFVSASIKLHNNMFRCIIRTPISFLDNNPIARSPVLSHLSASLYGLTTIRAFNVKNKFKSTFNKYQDKHTATWFIYVALNRWNCAYGQTICFLNIIATIVVLCITMPSIDAGSKIGLIINYELMLILYFHWGTHHLSETDYQMNSVARILNYSKLKSEAAYESSPDKQPPADWPQKGEIEFKNVSLKYSNDRSIVLNNLSFLIKPGEKIGIVGRTGAGKSSIIASLFRMTEPTGMIIVDGIDTKNIGLRDLRSKISIIPQDPVLFTGPLRRNIDPFNEYSEEMLWQAIEKVQLKDVIKNLPGGMDTHLTEGGRNFSVGERQLICLARTILCQNKILVMDEATSNIDKITDTYIQKIIRENFTSCTVLTIAHRLNTIIDSDRVMVLHRGIIQEFDSPYALLKDVNGTFYNLVKNTGKTSMSELYNIAKDKFYDRQIILNTKL
ncbi:multidrug resistance-associated protein 4-like [Centruroides sculpturatus]|uniref:multidrug resistance-associated protein 4-like n=1 Tax=Centruroides sculpturatus TaxID=218467 RepID=UPI000C6E336C|nr:multidrug resistance-associated protein 4-like [Centruroides sculpturatus]